MRALTVKLCKAGISIPDLYSLKAAYSIINGSLFEKNRVHSRAISERVLKTREAIEKFKSDKPSIAGAGFIFEKDGCLFQHISKSKIIPYIQTNAQFIEAVDWSALEATDDSIRLNTDTIELIHPFDNATFWKYASNKINNINLDFIRRYIDKINFSDELTTENAYNNGQTASLKQGISLSSNQNLDWNRELINEFLTQWNWTFLARNPAIIWDTELISAYESEIDFNELSSREDIEWTHELIYKYENLWNWEAMSSNSSLPWNYAFIKKFETRWTWKPKSYGYISYPSIYRNELRSKSLSNNRGIRWTAEFIEFIDKVDVWVIAANAYLSPFFISHARKSLDEERLTYHVWERNSDWPSEKVETFTSGWDYIQKNNYT